jgi:hypothetical protein
MIRNIFLSIIAICITACEPAVNEADIAGENSERIYVGEHNYIETVSSLKRTFNDGVDRSQIQEFPQYYVYRAKEWPREDLNDESSYDLPRIQFFWPNQGDNSHPLYDNYEGKDKIWSMKTDGTDLRLVTDDFYGYARGKMARSPNNRYLAYGYAGGGKIVKAVYDLKTKETHILGEEIGVPRFVWAEDSSYLYFSDTRRDVYKWDVDTKEKSIVEFSITDAGVIFNNIRYEVNVFGVRLNIEGEDKIKDKALWGEDLEFKAARANSTSISPDGRHAWAASNEYGFEINTETGEVIRHEMYTFMMPHILGLNGRFGANKNVTTMNVVDFITDAQWTWRPLGTNGAVGEAALYNGFANNGLWFKEIE